MAYGQNACSSHPLTKSYLKNIKHTNKHAFYSIAQNCHIHHQQNYTQHNIKHGAECYTNYKVISYHNYYYRTNTNTLEVKIKSYTCAQKMYCWCHFCASDKCTCFAR